MPNNDGFNETLDDYVQQELHDVFNDIEEQLVAIENTLETESSRILLNWIRDAIARVHETYTG